ncbi:MAG TPA: recombinase family protein [Planctomycetota bacterium]|nr:recombinase family protein [Planctomycetota bacterium]
MRVGIYIRYSSHNQDGNLTIDIQERRCREFIAGKPELSGQEAELFIDAAATGATFNRPEFQRMAAAVKARELAAVVVYKYDRLGRDGLESERYNREFAFAGAPVLSATEPAHDLSRWVLAGVAEEFRRQLGQRCQDALRQNAEAGYWNGHAPYGYQLKRVRVNDGKRGERATLEVDPTEAGTVRRIFDMAAQRMSLRDIALKLNAEGLKSPRGGAWDLGGVRSLLVNPIYVGKRVALRWIRRRGPDGRRIQRLRPQSEWAEQDRPEWRIVSEERWAEVDALFSARRRAREHGDRAALARTMPASYLLSGLIRCGHCGGWMVVNKLGASQDRPRPSYYLGCSLHRRQGPTVCPNERRYPVQPVEDTILSAIEEHVLGPDARPELLRTIERKADARTTGDNGRAGLERRLAKLKAEIGRLVETLASGGGASNVLAAAIGEREAEIKRLSAELAGLKDDRHRGERLLAAARRKVSELAESLAGVVARTVTAKPDLRTALAGLVPDAQLVTETGGRQRLRFKIAPAAALAAAGGCMHGVGDPNGI